MDRAWADWYSEEGTVVERKRESIREVFGKEKLLHNQPRAEVHVNAATAQPPPHRAHTPEMYRWEAMTDAEGMHREAIAHAVRSHEMTEKEYKALHEKDYGPLADFLADPSRGEWPEPPSVPYAGGRQPRKRPT